MVEDRPRRGASVGAEVAVEGGERTVEAEDARFLEEAGAREFRRHGLVAAAINRSSGGYDIGPPGEGRQLKVVPIASENVEWPAGTEFDQWCECPIAEDFAGESVAAESSSLVDAAEDETVTLIEGGGGTISAGEVTVLRGESGLQIGGIIDRVRPGIRSEEFVMLAEAFAEIGHPPI